MINYDTNDLWLFAWDIWLYWFRCRNRRLSRQSYLGFWGTIVSGNFLAVGGSLFYYGRLAKISKETITDKSVGDKEEITTSEEASSDNEKDSPEDK